MWPKWGPSGADRTQVGPMLAPLTLLSGWLTWTALSVISWSNLGYRWKRTYHMLYRYHSFNVMLQNITVYMYHYMQSYHLTFFINVAKRLCPELCPITLKHLTNFDGFFPKPLTCLDLNEKLENIVMMISCKDIGYFIARYTTTTYNLKLYLLLFDMGYANQDVLTVIAIVFAQQLMLITYAFIVVRNAFFLFKFHRR